MFDNGSRGVPMPGRRTKFTPAVIEQIPCLVKEGKTPAEIAQLIGCTISSLRVRCSHLRISLRRDRPKDEVQRLVVLLPPNTVAELERRGELSGMSGSQLAADLLVAVVRDHLYKAVLDRDL